MTEANGLAAMEATEAYVAANLVGGRVFEASLDDEGVGYDVPRDDSGRVLPHILIDWLATTPSRNDRSLGLGEQEQPHSLFGSFACIAGDAKTARKVRAALFDLLVDWKPTSKSNAFTAQGGFRERIERKSSTVPERFVFMQYASTTVQV